MAVVECRKEGRIAHIVINRPDAMNALNAEGLLTQCLVSAEALYTVPSEA
jgi:enoyl-CoA hydratase/carnithine racemase